MFALTLTLSYVKQQDPEVNSYLPELFLMTFLSASKAIVLASSLF